MPVSPRPLDPTKQQPQYSQHRRPSRTFLTSAGVLIERVAERLLTFCYHESFQRNTIEPLTRIIAAADHDARSHLLREWADLKAEESKYIQIAVSKPLAPGLCSTDSACRAAFSSRQWQPVSLGPLLSKLTGQPQPCSTSALYLHW